MSKYLQLLLFIPLVFGGLAGFFMFVAMILNILERKSFLKSFKKNNNRWTNLDSKLPIIDKKRKEVDGSYYQEKPFLIVKGEYWNGMSYPYKTIEMTIIDKSILRWVCRFLIKSRADVSVYTAYQSYGKIIYDRSHARRYIYS